MRSLLPAFAILALTGCAVDAERSFAPEASIAASGGEAPVVVRLRTRSGVRDVTVHDIASSADGHRLDVMRAWAGTDEGLMHETPIDELAPTR